MLIDTLSAGDRVHLLELYARSVMLLELGRCAEWVELFSPRAVVRCADANEGCPIEFKGCDELLTLGRQLMLGDFDVVAGHQVPPLRCRHLLSNVTLFAQEARHVSGYAFVTITTIGGREPPRWLGSGRYSDSLFKCPTGCWLFESRTFVSDALITAAGGEKTSVAPPPIATVG